MVNEIPNTEITTISENLPIPADRLAALRQKAAKPIEAWQPVAGDALIGQIVGIRPAVGTYGENLQVLVKEEAGNITAAWLTQWLKENLRAQGAGEGDLIALTFLGKKTSPSNRSYNAYSVMVDRIDRVVKADY
jgi:hypothetical protein